MCSCSSASVYSIQGMPPTTSAPSSMAWRTRSAAPGSRTTPSCGKATTWTSTIPLNSSRTWMSALTPSRRALVSTSAKARMWVLPNLAAHRGPAYVGDDPRLVVLVLDPRGQLDGGHRLAHAACLIGLDRHLVHHLQGKDLAEMEMRVDKGLGHQVAPGVDLGAAVLSNFGLDSDDLVIRDTHLHQPAGSAAQPGISNQDVKWFCHMGTSSSRMCEGQDGGDSAALSAFSLSDQRRLLYAILRPCQSSLAALHQSGIRIYSRVRTTNRPITKRGHLDSAPRPRRYAAPGLVENHSKGNL